MNKKSTHGNSVRDQILEYLRKSTVKVAPVSYREIAAALGFASSNTIEHHLRILESEGRIELSGYKSIKVK